MSLSQYKFSAGPDVESRTVNKRSAQYPRVGDQDFCFKRLKTDTNGTAADFSKFYDSPAAEAIELCELLLDRAGHNPRDLERNPKMIAQLLSSEYSPRVAQLLCHIVQRLEEVSEKHSTSGYNIVLTKSPPSHIVPVVPGVEGDDFDTVSRLSLSSSEEQLIPDIYPFADLKKLESASAPAQEKDHDLDLSFVEETAPVLSDRERKESNDVAYKKDTEIALSRIFSLGDVAGAQDPSVAPFDPYYGPSVVCMSGFGELGRFGNQVLQYAFLKSYASQHGISEVQVPSWVGAGLFGLNDRPVQRAFPAVVETREAKANSTFTTEFMDYIKASNAGQPVPEVDASNLTCNPISTSCGTCVDFWGWFQWHTSCYLPYKRLIHDLFTPVPDLQNTLSVAFDKSLRYRDGVRRTVVGLHLRLGDYQNISASSFGYCAPTSWYLELLDKIWPELENPVLFVASDDLQAVLRDFAKYDPVTADMANIKVPDSMTHLKAGFFPDWWSLTQCDILAISNSTFSFTACMMNQQVNAQFYRAHYAKRMIPFDPWNSDPIIHRDMSGAGLMNAVGTLQLVYNTQGARGVVRNVLYELPYYGIRSAIMKAVLWRSARTRQQPKSDLSSTSSHVVSVR